MTENIFTFEKNLEADFSRILRDNLDLPVFHTFSKIELVVPRLQLKVTMGAELNDGNSRPYGINGVLRIEIIRERQEVYESMLGKLRWLMSPQANLFRSDLYSLVEMSHQSSERESIELEGGKTLDLETLEMSFAIMVKN